MIKKSIELVCGGNIRFSIYLEPKQTAEKILEPAYELIQYLNKSIGGNIPMMDDSYPLKLVMFMDYCSGLEREEFEINAEDIGVVLRAGTVEGMFHAVYDFLESFVGIRWLWPGEDGEVVPDINTLLIPCGVRREKPDFSWRAIQTGGAMVGGLDYNSFLHTVLNLPQSYRKKFETWCRRNRFGGLKAACGHRWSEIAPPEVYGKTNPEYYALFDGKRDSQPHDGKHGNQPCLSNPDVIDRMANYACCRFDAEKELDVFSIALNDGGNSCDCDECIRIDEMANASDVQTIEHFDRITREMGSTMAKNRSVTDRLFFSAAKVAEKVEKRYPGRMLLTHLYHFYRRPPVTFSLPENVIGQFCIMGNMFWNEEIRKSETGRLRTMSSYVPSLGIYEYYSNGAWPEIHRLFPELIEKTVRNYYNCGARYFATQPSQGFGTNGFNFYMLGRMLWNVNTCYECILDDFCAKGFGEAAPDVKKYLCAFAIRWKETESGTGLPVAPEPRLSLAYLYDRPFLEARNKDLANARLNAGKDERILKRIEFFQKGLEYTGLYCEALRESLELYRSCGAEDFEELKNSSVEAGKILNALDAWDAYWDFIKENSGKYIFGEMWANYRPGINGSNDPLIKLLKEKLSYTENSRLIPLI